MTQIAEGTHRRINEHCRIEVLDDMVPGPDRAGIGDLADQVGTVGRVGQAVATLAAGETDVDRYT